MKRTPSFLLVLAVLLLVASPSHAGDAPPATPTTPPGAITGRVELLPGVYPEPGTCQVVVMGTPLASMCGPHGQFKLGKMPGGDWEIQIRVDGLPTRTVWGSSRTRQEEPGSAVDLGTIIVARPAAISGKVKLPRIASDDDYDRVVVGIAELGIYTQLGVGGQYLLTGVAPGQWAVHVFKNNVVISGSTVTVGNGALVQDVDHHVH